MDNALLSSPYANSINAQSLISRIITEITPFVRQALVQEVQKVQGQRSDIEDRVVNQVTNQLRPNVLKIVQASVSNAGIDTSDTTQLLEIIMVQLRPVVLGEVQTALRTSPSLVESYSSSSSLPLSRHL